MIEAAFDNIMNNVDELINDAHELKMKYGNMDKIIYPDGTVKETSPKNGKFYELKELQEIVNGFIELVPISTTQYAVINEEGKILNLPLNRLATLDYSCALWNNDYFAGNVLICDKNHIV